MSAGVEYEFLLIAPGVMGIFKLKSGLSLPE